MNIRSHDPRPDVWIGHVSLRAADVRAVSAALQQAGMRRMELDADVEILELRGGTHLIISAADARHPATRKARFDLMVDDVDAAHTYYEKAGLACSAIERGRIHDHFDLTLPGGCSVRVNSSHVIGLPV